MIKDNIKFVSNAVAVSAMKLTEDNSDEVLDFLKSNECDICYYQKQEFISSYINAVSVDKYICIRIDDWVVIDHLKNIYTCSDDFFKLTFKQAN